MNAACHNAPALVVALLVAAAGFPGAAQTTNGVASATNTVALSARLSPQPTHAAVQSTNAAAPTTHLAAPSTHLPAQPPSPPLPSPSPPAPAASAAQGLDESAFRILAERNIFDANRSGGTVRLSSRRPSVVESFTLVGTLAYEKGAFAFFEGSNSEFTKALKPAGLIAGHKLVDVYANSVKLDVDGKELELPLGAQMRREDEGTWHVAEAHGGFNASPGGENETSSRYNRSDRGRDSWRSRREGGESVRDESAEARGPAPAPTSSPNANQAEILKRLMERREKESQ